nr:hypothetical transcript [Hymenolepis microstoma]
MLYCCEILVTASEAILKPLEKTHNHALRLITGGIKSTPIDAMLLVTENSTIRSSVEEKALTLYEKPPRISSDKFWSNSALGLQRLRVPTPNELHHVYIASPRTSLAPFITISKASNRTMLQQTHSTEILSNSISDFRERLPISISSENKNVQQQSDDSGLDNSWMPSIDTSGNSDRVPPESCVSEAAQLPSEAISQVSYRCKYCQKLYVRKSSCRNPNFSKKEDDNMTTYFST